MYGDYRLTRDDVLPPPGFDDGIGLCGAPIEDHHGGADTVWHYLPDGGWWDPLPVALVRDAANVLVAGSVLQRHPRCARLGPLDGPVHGDGPGGGDGGGAGRLERPRPTRRRRRALRDRLRADGARLELDA